MFTDISDQPGLRGYYCTAIPRLDKYNFIVHPGLKRYSVSYEYISICTKDNIIQIILNTNHLESIKSRHTHRFPAGSGGKHVSDPGRSAHDPWAVTQHEDELLDVPWAERPVLTGGEGHQLHALHHLGCRGADTQPDPSQTDITCKRCYGISCICLILRL